MASSPNYDIAVVGGGPVGAAAALALGQAGFRLVLLEAAAPPPAFGANRYSSHVYALSRASHRLLDEVGVWSGIATQRVSPYAAMRVWVDAPERGLDFRSSGMAVAELGWIVEHELLMDALWRALPGIEVDVVADAGAVRREMDGAASRLHFAGGRCISARLVVAADGSASALRRAAEIDTVGWGYAQRAIVCNVTTGVPHQGSCWQRFLRTGPVALLPLADGRSSLVWSVDDDLAQELLKLDDAGFVARLGQAMPRFAPVTAPTPRFSFPLRLLHAVDYTAPGLVLVGDAAHTLHPLAGQGVNLGLGDVAALRRALTAARHAGRDWAGSRPLAAYARARRADNVEMLAVTDLLQRAFALSVPGVRGMLGAGLAAVGWAAPLKGWLARQALG
ncbi:MAG TPA: FAD-dependent monooxygenase [Nevskiaceae bacterium]|nr:FAD-dependent monooxygenase [Nevskiaceae bacterium]